MSRRLAALNFGLRTLARPMLRRTKTPEAARREFEISARILFCDPPGLVAARRSVPGPGGPVPVTRIAAGPVAEDAAVLYFHGGGYVAGSPRTHRAMLGRLAALSGVAVHAADYRLAPAAPAPAAFEDAVAAWEALAGEGLAPGRIVIGGDSAGGGLALALLAELCRRHTPPAGAFAFAPWTDLALTGPSLAANAETDVLLPRSRVEELVGVVLAGLDPRDARVSPLYADYPGAPPVYLQASEVEILRDDTLRMAERLRQAGGVATVDLWPDPPHVWHLFGGWLPEAQDALARAARFVADRLRPPPPPAGS